MSAGRRAESCCWGSIQPICPAIYPQGGLGEKAGVGMHQPAPCRSVRSTINPSTGEVEGWGLRYWEVAEPDDQPAAPSAQRRGGCCISVNVNAVCPCWIFISMHVPTAFPCCMSALHAHVHAACPCPCCMSCLILLVLSSSPVLAALPWQSCPGSPPVLAALSRQSCPGSPVLAVWSLQSFSGSPALSVFYCQSCSSCPVMSVLYGCSVCLSCSAYPVLHVLFCLSCSACLLSQSSCSCPVLLFSFACLFCLSSSACPVLIVLSWLYSPSCLRVYIYFIDVYI
jgi:hypothetical protein